MAARAGATGSQLIDSRLIDSNLIDSHLIDSHLIDAPMTPISPPSERASSRDRAQPGPGHGALVAVLAVALAGCVVVPSGPSQTALPGSRSGGEQFRQDDAVCQQVAASQTGGDPAQAANNAAVGSALAGAALGATAGALIGGNSRGAGVGAGLGLLMGSAVGADSAQATYRANQRRYDSVYLNCMYERGHRVPAGSVVQARREPRYIENSAPAAPASPPLPPATGSVPPDYRPPATTGPGYVPAVPPPNAPPPRY